VVASRRNEYAARHAGVPHERFWRKPELLRFLHRLWLLVIGVHGAAGCLALAAGGTRTETSRACQAVRCRAVRRFDRRRNHPLEVHRTSACADFAGGDGHDRSFLLPAAARENRIIHRYEFVWAASATVALVSTAFTQLAPSRPGFEGATASDSVRLARCPAKLRAFVGFRFGDVCCHLTSHHGLSIGDEAVNLYAPIEDESWAIRNRTTQTSRH
jgi:hypothetical protein